MTRFTEEKRNYGLARVVIAIAMMVILGLLSTGCTAGNLGGEGGASTSAEDPLPSEQKPAAKDFSFDDGKYTVTADEEWEDVSKEYSDAGEEMDLFLRKEMLYLGAITRDRADYDGLVKIQNCKDYAKEVLEGMESGSDKVEWGELTAFTAGGCEGWQVEGTITREDVELGYRIYFLDTEEDYVELLFWTDKGLLSEYSETFQTMAETFVKSW